MAKRKQKTMTDIRQKCLFRTFADINYNFSDWYRATQLDIESMAQELNRNLFTNNL